MYKYNNKCISQRNIDTLYIILLTWKLFLRSTMWRIFPSPSLAWESCAILANSCNTILSYEVSSEEQWSSFLEDPSFTKSSIIFWSFSLCFCCCFSSSSSVGIVGQKIFKNPGQKNSWNQINQFHEKNFDQIHFFAISKMAKNEFFPWKKFRTAINVISRKKFWPKIHFLQFQKWPNINFWTRKT